MAQKNVRMLTLIAACGGACGVASAQPFQVNGSGATLLEALWNAPATTNDFLDVDGDGLFAPDDVDQLAPADPNCALGDPNLEIILTYRVVGSGNGFAELVRWGGPGVFATNPDLSDENETLNSDFSDSSLWNRVEYVAAGVPVEPCYNANTPGGYPFSQLTDGTFEVNSDPTAAAIHMDFASLDVPVAWASTQAFTGLPVLPEPEANPGQPGYGNNQRFAVNPDGSLTDCDGDPKTFDPWDNFLEDLGDLNVNTQNPDNKTVFDTNFTLTPIAAIVNFGVGREQIKQSNLRNLAATGRLVSGENLTKVTRDSGSGTRNGWMNGVCLDPSWGVGENIGCRTVSSDNDLVGPFYQPSNKGGSSRNEATTINTRLGIGHTGAERGESKGWLTGGQLEVLAIQPDLIGTSTSFNRPTLDNVVNNDPDSNGYPIISPAVVASVGDPLNENVIGGEPGNTNPAPENDAAAAVLNNITRSVEDFEMPTDKNGDGVIDENDLPFFSPGEFVATQFLLVAAADFVPSLTDPCNILPNPAKNPFIQDFILNESGNVLGLPEYQTFNQDTAGLVPTRETDDGGAAPIVYSDGQTNNYITQNGTLLTYGDSMPKGSIEYRNKIANDFNGDGLRDINDFADMMEAANQRMIGGGDGAVWSAPNSTFNTVADAGGACIEILGDHNNDGNFSMADIRYAADGLAMVAGGGAEPTLDRAAGFLAVDNEWNTITGGDDNFFDTVVTGTGYEPGDSRADVSNPNVSFEVVDLNADGTGDEIVWTGVTRGWEPIGADKVVDLNDVDYICAQFSINPKITDGAVNWGTDLVESAFADLSADMNGDLIIDILDVIDVVQNVLDTEIGDLDLDGDVDNDDLAIATANLGKMNPTYSDGDVDCDGDVDNDDLLAICGGDCNGDGNLNILDFTCFQGEFAGQTDFGDCDDNGMFNILDFICFQANFEACQN